MQGETKPDQYDLPAPTKQGAIAASTATDKSQPNGHVPDSEDSRWATDRTGWAPRFGSPGGDDSADDSGLDHQTWVEGHLDDKWFGGSSASGSFLSCASLSAANGLEEWYHNSALVVFACLSTWFICLLGGGLGWVFLIMACCGTYYRTSIRRLRRNVRDDLNREFAKNRLETDVESLEWINSFTLKFWPIFQPVLADIVINSVDQVLSTSTPAFLDSLRLKTFTLGTKPPRLEHVKSYPKAEDDIVLMDWKFSFTPKDTLDMTARQLKAKVNP